MKAFFIYQMEYYSFQNMGILYSFTEIYRPSIISTAHPYHLPGGKLLPTDGSFGHSGITIIGSSSIYVLKRLWHCVTFLFTLHYIALLSMDPKPVKLTIRCGICHINTKNTKYMCSITEDLKQENPRIHSGYTSGYLKIQELFCRE
jgi:hypothetical protein